MLDAIPLSIGVEVMGDLFTVIISRLSVFPCKIFKVFHTIKNDQLSIAFRVSFFYFIIDNILSNFFFSFTKVSANSLLKTVFWEN